jgi:hypothetical protein
LGQEEHLGLDLSMHNETIGGDQIKDDRRVSQILEGRRPPNPYGDIGLTMTQSRTDEDGRPVGAPQIQMLATPSMAPPAVVVPGLAPTPPRRADELA